MSFFFSYVRHNLKKANNQLLKVMKYTSYSVCKILIVCCELK